MAPQRPVGPPIDRRALLLGGAGLGLSVLSSCQSGATPGAEPKPGAEPQPGAASRTGAGSAPLRLGAPSSVLELVRLGSPPWKTFDPFLFCVHHRDDYPAGNPQLGPVAPLAGRDIGRDFANKDGWNMYHGDVVPGFPRHPHRGFETVTVTRRGFIDHSDSLGATARYGDGDVQWMTAGSGIVHAEMFPLLDARGRNQSELFQIWLNLPASRKFAKPHFSMFWQNQVPRLERVDDAGRPVSVTIVAGSVAGLTPPAPPPDSWASNPEADVAIWSIVLSPGARFQLPRAESGTDRTLYVFEGERVRVGDVDVAPGNAARLQRGPAVQLENGSRPAELLLLQGRPIGEPVVAQGPFVMNRRSEIEQAIRDYQRTQFGGWPWTGGGPVHARDSGRFAVHADGRRERAT